MNLIQLMRHPTTETCNQSRSALDAVLSNWDNICREVGEDDADEDAAISGQLRKFMTEREVQLSTDVNETSFTHAHTQRTSSDVLIVVVWKAGCACFDCSCLCVITRTRERTN